MKKTTFTARLLAASLLVTAAAPAVQAADRAAPVTAQKAGAYIDDSVITAKVKAALVEDKQVSAMKINVTTKDGVVTLKGSVPSAELGQHALQLVAGIEGVRDVKSDLTVKAG
ncbi:BON domain-containing protein [Herbaspirillum seropedicae]|jgi:hyperosmotically inducible protein|uniref:Hyperosmotically inducible periplasmic protein n=1 Tax=Herbaspirillum seropedicae (strain SmR1) TaxID=757424 RepID=D8IY77_HERSS|nr:BON domain-containing protein [Herbaspirillum seropedicae]ADJ66199.1 hyperosmotically inducible periplasmic protein [Herbaspirillum seropedicae SmR1]AKN67954.1 hydrogenase [Herbaspirillum seropedicae]MDR6398245.1 hyperosmotically inducible protein [Herbaspirillum seropedicae]NQE30042.1 hydrogenase [Herbaspirillum seropedicae]QDD66946.1 BON domain-containing protein [Herbaspirillum seropedicae]